MDNLTHDQRKYNMSRIRAADTTPEVMLRKSLWHNGWRYRKNYTRLPGKPDIAFTRQKIAVFVDGDFWHARGHQDNPGEQVASNKDYDEARQLINALVDQYELLDYPEDEARQEAAAKEFLKIWYRCLERCA